MLKSKRGKRKEEEEKKSVGDTAGLDYHYSVCATSKRLLDVLQTGEEILMPLKQGCPKCVPGTESGPPKGFSRP